MAGRPRRRARAAEIPDIPVPDKPLAEMTLDERRAYARKLKKAVDQPARERKLRAGLAKPRSQAEWAIFASDLLGRSLDAED